MAFLRSDGNYKTKSGDIQNIKVAKSNRNLFSMGFYPVPKQPLVAPQYKQPILEASDHNVITDTSGKYFNADYLYVVMAIKFNTYQSQSGAVSCVRLYAMNLGTLMSKTQGTDDILLTTDILVQEFVNGIYESKTYISGSLSTTVKAEIVNAWIIEKDLIKLGTINAYHERRFTTRTSLANWTDYEFSPYPVLACSTKSRTITFTTEPYKTYYAGTKFNNLQITSTVYDVSIEIRTIIGTDNLKVFALQGDNQIEITPAFSLNLTQVDGDISLQRQILDQFTNTLPILAIAGTIGVGLISQNPIAIGGGVLSLANSAAKYAEAQLPQRMGNLVRAGDAITTFCEDSYVYVGIGGFTRAASNPYYIVEYEDDTTGLDDIKYYGINYDYVMPSITAILNRDDILTNSSTAGTIDGFDYLKCTDLTFNGNIPKEAQEFIYDKLINGIRIKKINPAT